MIVWVRHRQYGIALPAELRVAILAYHLVTAFSLLYRKVTHWASFGTILDIEQVQTFFNQVLGISDALSILAKVHGCFLTSFEGMPLEPELS